MPPPFRRAVSLLLAAALLTPGVIGARSAEDPGQAAQVTPGEALSSADLAEMQRLLKSLDFYAGDADGIAGPITRAAIKEFQRSIGRAADGSATRGLLERLRSQAARGGQATDGSAHLGAAIVAAPERPRLDRLIDTDFFGETAVPTPWRVAGEGFTLHRQHGMRAGRERGTVLRILHDAWSDLEEALGVSDATPETAVLYGPRSFSGPFELTVGFRMAERAGQLMIGPYSGDQYRSGYRCVFSPAAGHRVALVRIENGRESVIAERSLPKRIVPGLLHELIWRRSDGGKIDIALGKVELFSVPGGDDATFGGIAISARNGGYSISHVKLRAATADAALSANR